MSAIERVMKAYTSKHDLSPEQAALVRAELSSFIGELISGKATMVPGKTDAAAMEKSSGARESTGNPAQ